MKITFKEFIDEIDALVDFLTSQTWEYHGTPDPNPERIRVSYANHYYNSDDSKTFWIVLDDSIRAGIIRIFDLDDGNPLFDIRILSSYKGIGIGTSTVRWLVEYIFTNYPDKYRVEGTTREDNYAMRCVFHKCGFVREAHYRSGWPTRNGKVYDAIGYAILKNDWKENKVTPVNWNDFKY